MTLALKAAAIPDEIKEDSMQKGAMIKVFCYYFLSKYGMFPRKWCPSTLLLALGIET